MGRRWILAAAATMCLALATHGFCYGSVKRPVVRFIDFYIAADQAERPVTLFERVTFGLAVAAQPDPIATPISDPVSASSGD